jgi:Ca2+-binding EF-hand superfamily protein
MLRVVFSFATVLALAGVLVLSADAADQAQEKKKKKIDVNALFQRLDKDNDNKLSKDEFTKLGDVSGKAKVAAKTDKLFSRLDTNGDNSLSRDEFAKLAEKKKKKNNANE